MSDVQMCRKLAEMGGRENLGEGHVPLTTVQPESFNAKAITRGRDALSATSLWGGWWTRDRAISLSVTTSWE